MGRRGGERKDKKGDKGERRDKGRYLNFISKQSFIGLVLFILPILQVRKLKLSDHLSNLGPEAD